MKPTDEERREVAENLRTMCVCGCRYAEQFYELLNETVMDPWDFHDFPDVAYRLADLIEPPFPPCEETEEWLDSIKREGQPKTVRDVIEDIIWTCSTVDIGPNGNVSSSGVDEGIVSTDSLISAWETQLAALIEPEPERTCMPIMPPYEPGVEEIPVCSECGRQMFFEDDDAYCPRCGAKVIEEES